MVVSAVKVKACTLIELLAVISIIALWVLGDIDLIADASSTFLFGDLQQRGDAEPHASVYQHGNEEGTLLEAFQGNLYAPRANVFDPDRHKE